jgi:hypothetical protein
LIALSTSDSRPDRNRLHFAIRLWHLRARCNSAIEQAYGRPLEWEELPGKKACRVADYAEGDVTQTERFDEFIEWFLDAGTRFRRAMAVACVPPATGVGHPTLSGEKEPP